MKQSEQREPPRIILRLLEFGVVLGALLRHRRAPHMPQGVDAEDLALGYERSDMRPAAVIAGAIGLLVTLLVVLVLVSTFMAALTGIPFTIGRPADLINGLQAAPQPTPPTPRLEAQSGQSFEPYRAAEEQKLSTYRWVDRQAGIATMPIDRAMDLIAQRGLPTRANPTAVARDPGNTSPSTASSGRVNEAYP